MNNKEKIYFEALTKDRSEIADVLDRRAVRGYKDSVVEKLAGDKYCPGYKKGDQKTTYEIAAKYETGIENGKWSLKRIEDELLGATTEDEKYKILYFTDSTFTNAHEAIEYLAAL